MLKSFHPKEYALLMYDPTKVPEGNSILKYFKELGKVKAFRDDPGPAIDNEKVMQWVLLVYDMHSPYRKKFPDVLKRKVEVAHDIEFKIIEGGVFEPPIEDMLRGKNEKVNWKVVEYVRLHRSFKYAFLVSMENAYYNLMHEILGGETKNIMKAKELRDELEENVSDILNDDNNAFIKDALLRYLENERLNLRPEDIALKLQKGETPVTIKSIKG